jgi:ABC-type glycerol-3-phosphate transport system substrate-binding protein
MKTKRSLLAVAITLAAAACSGDITAPDPALRAPASAHHTTSTENPTTVVAPEEPKDDSGGDNGSWGSGCCVNR